RRKETQQRHRVLRLFAPHRNCLASFSTDFGGSCRAALHGGSVSRKCELNVCRGLWIGLGDSSLALIHHPASDCPEDYWTHRKRRFEIGAVKWKPNLKIF